MSREATTVKTPEGENARLDGGPSRLPRPDAPEDPGRMAEAVPPEAVRPFLDALAEVISSWVVTRITAGPPPRTNRNSEADSGEGFDADSSGVRVAGSEVRRGRKEVR